MTGMNKSVTGKGPRRVGGASIPAPSAGRSSVPSGPGRAGAAWSALSVAGRLSRLGTQALARLLELELSCGRAEREAAHAEYHARYAEANLILHLASHPSLSDRKALRSHLLFLMDHEVMSPMGNRLALNDGKYRTVMVRLLVDFLSNV